MWNGSAEGHTFAQFEPGREQAVGDEEDSSQRRRSPADVVNGEQFHGDESNTGGMDAGYYTDLLVNGVEQSQELSPCSEPSIHVTRSTAKSS